jgi:hypothetical protein
VTDCGKVGTGNADCFGVGVVHIESRPELAVLVITFNDFKFQLEILPGPGTVGTELGIGDHRLIFASGDCVKRAGGFDFVSVKIDGSHIVFFLFC